MQFKADAVDEQQRLLIRRAVAEKLRFPVRSEAVVISAAPQAEKEALQLLLRKVCMQLSAADIFYRCAADDGKLDSLRQKLLHRHNDFVHRRPPGHDGRAVPVKKIALYFCTISVSPFF